MNSNMMEENKKIAFQNRIKASNSSEFSKQQKLNLFIKELEQNPEIVERLSNNRLDKLIAFYENMIAEKTKKIRSNI